MPVSSGENISFSDPPSLLLVEDDPEDARLFREVLRESRYAVDLQWVEELSAGLSALEESFPDLIVTDLSLPDSKGTEAVRRLVEAVPDRPIVVLTGQQTMELAMDCIDAGATGYLRKDELTPGLTARTLQTAMERKRIEAELRRQKAALRRSQKRNRSLFRDSSDAILMHDLEGRIQEVNPKAESLFGLSAEELRGRSILSLRAAERQETEQDRREALQAGDSFRTVSRFERADGSAFWGELSANTIEIEDQTLVRTMIRDVTERKEAEQSLREREAQLRSLANSIPGVIYQFSVGSDGTYGFNYVSERAESMLGLSTEPDAPYDQFVQQISPSHRTEFVKSVAEAVEQETTWSFEMPFEKPGGEQIWLLATSTPERQNGELVFNGVLLDITERKEAEQELRRSRDRLALQARMIDQVGQAVIATDVRGEITYWNAAAERIYGWTEEEVLGENVLELTVPNAAQDIAYEIMASLVEGDAWTGEFEAQRKDGSTFPAIVSDTPVLDDKGELVGVIGVTTDITKQKEAQRALRVERDRFATLFNNLPTPVIYGQRDERDQFLIQAVNRAFELVFGFEEEKVRGMDIQELLVPFADRERARDIREAFLAGKSIDREVRRETAEGTRDFRLQVASREGEDGSMEGYAIYTDITEQKRREQTLQDRREKVESLYTATNELLTAKRPETVANRIHGLLRDTFDYALTGVDLELDGALVFVRGTYEDGIQGPSGEPRSVEGESLAARAYRAGEPVVVEDLSAFDNEIDYGELRSGASIPLGEHGAVNVGQVEQGEFDPFDLRLIEILAAHAGTVLDRIKREEDLREERDLLGRILETSPVAIVRFGDYQFLVDFPTRKEAPSQVLPLDSSR